jgi:hypothetical protein
MNPNTSSMAVLLAFLSAMQLALGIFIKQPIIYAASFLTACCFLVFLTNEIIAAIKKSK